MTKYKRCSLFCFFLLSGCTALIWLTWVFYLFSSGLSHISLCSYYCRIIPGHLCTHWLCLQRSQTFADTITFDGHIETKSLKWRETFKNIIYRVVQFAAFQWRHSNGIHSSLSHTHTHTHTHTGFINRIVSFSLLITPGLNCCCDPPVVNAAIFC